MFRSDFLYGVTAAFVGGTVRWLEPASTPTPDPAVFCNVNGAFQDNGPVAFKLPTVDGPVVNLRDYRGYALWINMFTASSMPSEQPLAAKLAAEYYPRGLRVIGVASFETSDAVRRYRQQYDVPYPIALDPDGRLAASLQGGISYRAGTRTTTAADGRVVTTTGGSNTTSESYPANLFVTPSGMVSCEHFGVVSELQLRAQIEKIVSLVPTPAEKRA